MFFMGFLVITKFNVFKVQSKGTINNRMEYQAFVPVPEKENRSSKPIATNATVFLGDIYCSKKMKHTERVDHSLRGLSVTSP